jgi:quercetin dioxygenase-like cupin family protein
MNKASILKEVSYKESGPSVSVLLQSDFTKEIRIAFKENQTMREHKTPYPIVVEIVEGTIDFGAEGETHHLEKGDILSLAGNIPHNLTATSQSIVRLTLFKADSATRVQKVATISL